MKTIIAVAAVILMVSPAYAVACVAPECPDSQTQSQYQNQAQNQSQDQSQSIVNTNTSSSVSGSSSSSNAVAYGGGGGSATAYGGAGGSATSYGMGGNAYNALTIQYEDKRELPNIPSAPDQRHIEYKGPWHGIFTFVKPWEFVSTWTSKAIENFPSCNWGRCDATVGKIRSREASDKFSVVKKGTKRYLGTILIFAQNPLEMWKEVVEKALEAGAEEVMENTFQSTFSNKSSGWNVGIGGGVTALSGGDGNVGGSVGGGTGIGSVTTEPKEKAQSVFTMFAN